MTTSQFDFTNAEWNDIASLPLLVGYAVAQTAESGYIGSHREIRTLIHQVQAGIIEGPARTLTAAISEVDFKERLAEYDGHDAAIISDVAVQACGAVAALMDAKADRDVATDYKHWLIDIATEVAATAKEDGVRVSPGEAALLERLREALGMQ